VICVTSLASTMPPNENIGFLYAAGKAAFNKLPEYLQHEHGRDGVLAFLIEPQFTMTDTMRARWGDQADAIGQGTQARKPEETARTVAWLAAHPDAGRFAGGQMLNAPDFFSQNGIAPLDGAPTGDQA
jgi:NAD(P)-dependent dehydrogenase (short-subunit alcohol dehydrogenase family)